MLGLKRLENLTLLTSGKTLKFSPWINIKSHTQYFASLFLLALLSLPLVTFAQSFPSKPIKLIVPSTLGDSADLVARVISAKLAERCLQPIDGFKLDKLPLVRFGRHAGS